jgi:iron complex outermembrane receptor protein
MSRQMINQKKQKMEREMGNRGILLAETALALSIACPAGAQQLPRESQQAAPSATPVAVQPEAKGTTDQSGLREIVVTAERRAVSVQHIPIAISAFTGDQLAKAGVTNPVDLNRLVSGLDFRSNTGSGLSLYIRGVGAQPLNGLADQANAFSVDGVFFSRPNGPDTTFYDLERVEVLKGPQGTLYGRNATAGAVNVITRKPRLQERDMSLLLTTGNYGARQAQVAVGLPIGDTLAVRAAVNLTGHDGYYHDGYNDLNTRAGRIHVYFEPSSRVNLLVTIDGAQQRGHGTAYVPFGPNAAEGLDTRFVGNPWDGPSSDAVDQFVRGRASVLTPTGASFPAPAFAARSLTAKAPGTDGFVHNNIWGVSGTLNVNLDFGTWTTVAGYREIRTNDLAYARWDALYSRFKSNETSVESRLSSNQGGPLQWIVGGSFNKERQSNVAWPESPNYGPANPASLLPFATDDPDYLMFNAPDIRNRSWAVFGQTTIKLADALRATGGVRYTNDRKVLGPGTQGYVDEPYSTTPFPDLVLAPPVPPFFPGIIISGALSPLRNSAEFHAITWTGGLEYDAGPRSLIYANVRKGYHAGGLIQGDNIGPNPTTYLTSSLFFHPC